MRKSVIAIATLLALTTQTSSAGEAKIVTAAQVNGTWETKQGEFKILALGQQALRVEFSGTRDTGRTVNLGEARGTAHIEGTTAVFKPDGMENCTITLEFKDKLMQVSQTGDSADCGFGMGVMADGVYRKAKAGKPTFTETH